MNYALALASAALLVLTFPRLSLVWLAPVALAPLLLAVARERSRRHHFLCGWAAGIFYWAGVCYWIQDVLERFGGLSAAGSWASFALFAFFKGLHMAVFALFAGLLMRSRWAVVAVPALWVAIERTHAALGFAWLALGNAGIDMALPLRLAPYAGVYGLSFVFAMLSTALALVALRRPRVELAGLLALPLLWLLPPLPPAQPGREIAVLVQPDISETADWTPQWADGVHQRLAMLSLQATLQPGTPAPQLLVWPEAPAPLYYYEDERFRSLVTRVAQDTHAYLLLNVVAHIPNGQPLNSALLVGPDGRALGRYDKTNLVPFGEYVPAPFGFVSKISTEVGDFAPGKGAIVLPAGEHRIGAFVCYESVFPHFVRRFAQQGAQLFVNISNDGWYGRTAARFQHLQIVRMRAAENRRWILRATNDGITSAIDPAGRAAIGLPSYEEGAVRAGFSWVDSTTVYTRYGDWFIWVSAAAAAAAVAAGLRRRAG